MTRSNSSLVSVPQRIEIINDARMLLDLDSELKVGVAELRDEPLDKVVSDVWLAEFRFIP